MDDLVLFFDGECRLCSRVVKFTADRDDGKFSFVPLQSDEVEELLEGTGIDPGALETFVVLDGEEVYTRSCAVVKLLEELDGGWRLTGLILEAVPKSLRDFGYSIIARSRYSIFGKKR